VTKQNYFNFSKFKTNFNYFITPNTSYETAVIASKLIYKPVYLSNTNDNFDKILQNDVLKNMKSGDKLAIIFLNSVEFLSDVQIYTITSNDKMYKQTPQMYMIFSYIKNRLLKTATKEYKFVKYEQNGDWSIAVFEKP